MSAKKYLFPAGMTFFILSIVYALSGLFPYGANTLSWGDMTQQALPFMMQFKEIAAGNDGLLFNMGNAGGMNYWGVFLYFMASPFTLLGLLVPRGFFHEFANILVLLKIMCAACSAVAFFSYRHSPYRRGPIQAGLLGVLYAFGGYTMQYYQNIVWLDQLIWFPLLFIALALLVKEGRVAPYVAALSACIGCQFQIGYMVILAVLFCSGVFVLLCMPAGQAGSVALRLGAGTLVAGITTGIVWLPVLFQYVHSARNVSFVDSVTFAGFLAPFETTLTSLLCTAPVLAGILFLLFTKKYKSIKTLGFIIVFLLFCLPLLVEPINLLWHTGGYQAFPSRFGFIPLFFGLILVSAALYEMDMIPPLEKNTRTGILVVFLELAVYALVLIYILVYHGSEADIYVRSLWGDLGSFGWALVSCFAGALALLILLYAHRNGLLNRKTAVLAMACLVAAGGIYNGMLYIGSPGRSTVDFRERMDLADHLPEDAGRVKLSRKYGDANEIGAMGYDSIAHYSSLTRPEVITAGKKMGYSGYWMEMSGLGGTALTDHLLGINSVFCRKDGLDPLYDENNIQFENYSYALVNTAYPGQYAQLTTASLEKIAFMPEGDRFHIQDWLYQNIYEQDGSLYRRYEPQGMVGAEVFFDSHTQEHVVTLTGKDTGTIWYEIAVEDKETLYFDCFRFLSSELYEVVNDGFAISVNGIVLEYSYPNGGCNGLLCLGTFENEMVTIQVEVLRTEVMRSYGVYGIPDTLVREAVENIRAVPVSVDGTKIRAQVQAGEAEHLLLMIPYDEGFTATVNGAKTEIYQVLDAYMAVPLQQGANEILLSFWPQGFRLGAAMTLLGIALLLLIWYREKRAAGPIPVTGKTGLLLEKTAKILLTIAFYVVFVIIYVFPLLMWLVKKVG